MMLALWQAGNKAYYWLLRLAGRHDQILKTQLHR